MTLAAERGAAALGASHPLTLRARCLVLSAHDARGEYHESARLHGALIADARRDLPRSALVLVEALSSRSFGLAKKDEAAASIAALEEAIAIAERYLGADHDVTITSIGLLGNTHGRFGHGPRQLATAEDALRRATAARGAQRPDVLLTRSERWYAEALLANQRPAEALPILERVVGDQRRLDTVDTPRVRAALQRLAEAYHAIGRLDRAVPLIREVVALEARHNPHPGDDRIGVLNVAGRIFTTARLLDDALLAFERCLQIRGARTVWCEVGRARALVWLGRAEGDALAAGLLAREPAVAAAVALEATMARAQHARLDGRPADARRLARDALRRAEEKPVWSQARANARCEIALASLDAADAASAAPEVERAFVELASAQVPRSPRAAECVVARARVELAAGRRDAARALIDALDRDFAAVNPRSPFRAELARLVAR